MFAEEWVLIDTETNGLAAPIVIVELAAQRMRGWERQGPPFRKLLNQNADISPEASRVNGYTREILERDGEPALEVYFEFATYVGDRPLVSYNTNYDLDKALKPEWKRLGIKPIGSQGFCALRFAQRLLDPVPAGNCKLQTLRQFYRLPERGAHTALGDVDTVIDLLRDVLAPLAKSRRLSSWDEICRFTAADWYPQRLGFGKFKGRDFRDARCDADLRSWLDWVANSANDRSARMGRWYLDQLASQDQDNVAAERLNISSFAEADASAAGSAVTVYVSLEAARLKELVVAARARLAELEAQYTRDKCDVEHVQASLFNLVREPYQARDRLKLIVEYRRRYLDALLREGEEGATTVEQEHKQAQDETDARYEEVGTAAAQATKMSDEVALELQGLWLDLVKLFHPDRHVGDPGKKSAYEQLTAAINKARDEGDMATLRAIASDAEGFMLQQGWDVLVLEDEREYQALEKLYTTLQIEIVTVLELISVLRAGPDFELLELSRRSSNFLSDVARKQKDALLREIADLETEAEALRREIEELGAACQIGAN